MADTVTPRTGPSGLQKTAGFLLGVLLFAVIATWPAPAGMRPEAKRMAATAVLMACWWIGESLPLGVTALVPLVAYPLLKIMPSARVAPNYANHYVFLLLGGFFIAISMQRWNLHKRIALWVIQLVGTGARRLVLGFMLATGFISMWISNSATAMMMMPIALGLVIQVEEMQESQADRSLANFGACMMLGVAYAANIGGVASLVGTFPNIVFAGMFKQHFPAAPEITFVDWLKVGLPFSAIFIPVMWGYIVMLGLPIRGRVVERADEIIKHEVAKLGSMNRGERMILGVFVTTALLWVFRSNIHLGGVTIPGWTNLLGLEKHVHDATVAMTMGLLCFMLPVNRKEKVYLLDWEHASKAPWDILLLFGGGFAIAAGFEQSGLTQWVGAQLEVLRNVPVHVMTGVVASLMTFMTEMTSNTATTTMTLPILAAAVSASRAFMLPIATPPNAIVFASGRVRLMQMARIGLLLNLIGIAFVTAFTYLIVAPAFGVSLSQLPAWMH
jgi:sodium-dependent dicarboxylate transporter 2/3/5